MDYMSATVNSFSVMSTNTHPTSIAYNKILLNNDAIRPALYLILLGGFKLTTNPYGLSEETSYFCWEVTRKRFRLRIQHELLPLKDGVESISVSMEVEVQRVGQRDAGS